VRRLAVLLLCLGFAACAPVIAPLGTENAAPALAQESFTARDGTELPVRHWDAAQPRAIIVALHGMGDYSNAFDAPATWWATQGITTYAYDQRGFGAAPHPGLWPGDETMRRDLDDFVVAVRAQHPGLPVFALGESMGGAVLLSALASPSPPAIDGAILVAPAVWSREDMPLSYRVALWTVAHTLPGLTLSGGGLHIWPSDNIPMLRKYSRDPLVQKETRADAVYGLANLMDEARQAPDHLDTPAPPILLLYGKNDQIIPAAPTEAVIAALGPHAEVHRYEHGYHMLLRDLDGPQIWPDVVKWIGAHTR
jgi:alpha-beta hydrolase superfamily lysophospholipase